jgi:hypothetical protein
VLPYDLQLALAGLVVGLAVGLTGMGGGALMTPIMVLIFKVDPLVAVGSDLLASLFMKPIGGFVHLRRKTVRTDIVLWLVIGAVPSAFAGAVLLDHLGAQHLDQLLKEAIGIALLASAGSMILRSRIQAMRSRGQQQRPVPLRRFETLAIGILGGLLVGLTSVGSGSVIIVLLLILYPGLTSAELVGTDLVQAVPLVGAAAIGHLFFGDVHLGLTAFLLVGAIPGVYIGAQFSSRAPDGIVRPALVVILVSSGLKLLQVI